MSFTKINKQVVHRIIFTVLVVEVECLMAEVVVEVAFQLVINLRVNYEGSMVTDESFLLI